MTKRNLYIMGITAAVTIITLTLPGLLWQRGLPIIWALALVGGYVIVAVLGYLGGKL
jgi:hypothetical protein